MQNLVQDPRAPTDISSGSGGTPPMSLYSDTSADNGLTAATLFSSIQDTPSFKKSVAPFPIIISTGRQPGELNVTL